MEKGHLIIFSGPSGVGKGTIKDKLLEDESLHLHYSVSCTTRQPRVGEMEGIHYYFVTHEKFNEMLLLKEERTKVKEETISKNLEQKEKVTLLEDSYKIALNLYNDFKNLSKLESDYQEKIIEQSQSYNKNLKHFEELTWAQPLKQSLHELEQDKKTSKDLEIKITDLTTKTLTEEKLLQNLLTENVATPSQFFNAPKIPDTLSFGQEALKGEEDPWFGFNDE